MGAGDFGVVPNIRRRIYNVDVVEVSLDTLAKSVKSLGIDERTIHDERDQTIFAQAIRRPAKEAGVHIVDNNLILGGAFLDVAVFDGLVDTLVGAVGVALIKVFLVGIVRRVADYNGDSAVIMLLNA